MVEPVHGFGVGPVQPGTQGGSRPSSTQGSTAFQDLLNQQLEQQEELKFSMHALERIRMRGLPLSSQELGRLREGVNLVAQKGGSESVVMMDDTAYVVSVKNRTVITAMGGEQMKNNVFTNIDSAVIV